MVTEMEFHAKINTVAKQEPSNYAIKRDLRENTGFKFIIGRVGPLFWLLGSNMGNYYCYTLSADRKSSTALEFLKQFIPGTELSWDQEDLEFTIGLPKIESFEQLTAFLEFNVATDISLYFSSSLERPPYCAILDYCSDGSLIFGLAADNNNESALTLLTSLENFVNDTGYWGGDSEAPPTSREEFTERRAFGREPRFEPVNA
jgi:hypothetical protein